MKNEEASPARESSSKKRQRDSGNSVIGSTLDQEAHFEGVKDVRSGRDTIIGKIRQTFVKLSINVAWPFNSRHERFIRYIAVGTYVTLMLGGLIRLWLESYASYFNISLTITGSLLLTLTCFYYTFFWKPSSSSHRPNPPKPPIKPEILEDFQFWPDPNAKDPERDAYRYLAQQKKYKETYGEKLVLRRESKKRYEKKLKQYEKNYKQYRERTRQRSKLLNQTITRRYVAAILMVVIPLSVPVSFWIWWTSPTNTIVTLADYYSESGYSRSNDLTGSIGDKLEEATYSQEKDIAIRYIGRAFKASERDKAIFEGKQRRATVSIWGRYLEGDKLKISTAFELLKSSLVASISNAAENLKIDDRDWTSYKLAYLEEVDVNINIDSEVENELLYLINFASGLAHYQAKNWQRALARFDAALEEIKKVEKVQSNLDESIVYYFLRSISSFYRGNTLFYSSYTSGDRSGYELAIANFTEAIELIPETSLISHGKDIFMSHDSYPHTILANYKISQAEADIREATNDQPIICGSQTQNTHTLVGNSPSQLKKYLARAYYNRGLSYAVTGNADRALSDYRKAFQLDPETDGLCIGLAASYALEEKYNPAIQNLGHAISTDTKNAAAYNNLGNIYAAQGEYKQAISNYNIAAKLEPSSSEIYYNRGKAFIAKQENNDEALALRDFNKAIESSISQNYIYYFDRGNLFFATGKYKQAIEDFKEAIKLNPDFPRAYYLIGESRLKYESDYIGAAESFEKVAELDPSSEAQLLSQLTSEAVESALDQAISSDFSSPMPHYNRSLYMINKGEFEKANRDFVKAFGLTSDIYFKLREDEDAYKTEELEKLQRSVQSVYETAETADLDLPNLVISNESHSTKRVSLNRISESGEEERVKELALFPSEKHFERLETGTYRISHREHTEIDKKSI
ncbi:MAG: tetratricopeptide repeat protein, partial [Cyanobacteria bacterium J06649_4]